MLNYITQNIFKCYSNCRTLSIKNTKRFEMLFNEQNPFKFITENTFNCYSNRAVSITQTQTLSLIQSLASLAKADVLCRWSVAECEVRELSTSLHYPELEVNFRLRVCSTSSLRLLVDLLPEPKIQPHSYIFKYKLHVLYLYIHIYICVYISNIYIYIYIYIYSIYIYIYSIYIHIIYLYIYIYI